MRFGPPFYLPACVATLNAGLADVQIDYLPHLRNQFWRVNRRTLKCEGVRRNRCSCWSRLSRGSPAPTHRASHCLQVDSLLLTPRGRCGSTVSTAFSGPSSVRSPPRPPQKLIRGLNWVDYMYYRTRTGGNRRLRLRGSRGFGP